MRRGLTTWPQSSPSPKGLGGQEKGAKEGWMGRRRAGREQGLGDPEVDGFQVINEVLHRN